MKTYKCPMCHDEHEIDKYGWVQSCIGYFELGNMINEIEKWLNEQTGKTKG
jgi:hypothetical protein